MRYFLPFLMLCLLAGFSRKAGAARVLDHYDLDSLCAQASAIVRVRVGDGTDIKTRDGNCTVHEVTVITVLQGPMEVGHTIRVAGLDEYRRGPGLGGSNESFPIITKGDDVYLFLVPKESPQGYAKYRLVDADWKIIESGVRLVSEGKVCAFWQYYPRPSPSMPAVVGPVPGFVSTLKDPVEPVAAFEEHVNRSLDFVGDLNRKFTAGTLTEAERDEILQKRTEVLKKEAASTDYIPHLLQQR